MSAGGCAPMWLSRPRNLCEPPGQVHRNVCPDGSSHLGLSSNACSVAAGTVGRGQTPPTQVFIAASPRTFYRLPISAPSCESYQRSGANSAWLGSECVGEKMLSGGGIVPDEVRPCRLPCQSSQQAQSTLPDVGWLRWLDALAKTPPDTGVAEEELWAFADHRCTPKGSEDFDPLRRSPASTSRLSQKVPHVLKVLLLEGRDGQARKRQQSLLSDFAGRFLHNSNEPASHLSISSEM